jgi:ABC-type branched-subunit amino acid transport system permease subunit
MRCQRVRHTDGLIIPARGCHEFLSRPVPDRPREASSLFLVASGLSLIFGVTRIVNFAHGSFYMLGAFLAVTLVADRALGADPRLLGLACWRRRSSSG